MRPHTFQALPDIWRYYNDVSTGIRSGKIRIGRSHYALSLMYGVLQAIHCGYPRISAAELGVAGGGGLMDLCRAAEFFMRTSGVQIDVYGLDNACGLPPPQDYRDCPEIWRHGQFHMGDSLRLQETLPDFAQLIIGDVGETTADLEQHLSGPLGFVAVDLDYYSSTTAAMQIFRFDPRHYVPAVPVYFDDIDGVLTQSEWCGEGLAVAEFNQQEKHRKIGKKEFGIPYFYLCHILDHPIRNKRETPRFPLEIFSGFAPESLPDERSSIVDFWQKTGRRIAIYPAGDHARWLMDNTPSLSNITCCFCDQNARQRGGVFYDRPLITLEELVASPPDIALIASPIHEDFFRNNLVQAGLGHIEIISTRELSKIARKLVHKKE